jgi:hypothetical protein
MIRKCVKILMGVLEKIIMSSQIANEVDQVIVHHFDNVGEISSCTAVSSEFASVETPKDYLSRVDGLRDDKRLSRRVLVDRYELDRLGAELFTSNLYHVFSNVHYGWRKFGNSVNFLFSELYSSQINGKGIVLAGGSVFRILKNTYLSFDGIRDTDPQTLKGDFDYDLFLFGFPSVEEANQYAREFIQNAYISGFSISCVGQVVNLTYNNGGAAQSEVKVQLVLRNFKSVSDLLYSFDIGCSQFAYDGLKIIYTPMALWCWNNKKIIVDPFVPSKNWSSRICKYFNSSRNNGFEVVFHSQVDRLIRGGGGGGGGGVRQVDDMIPSEEEGWRTIGSHFCSDLPLTKIEKAIDEFDLILADIALLAKKTDDRRASARGSMFEHMATQIALNRITDVWISEALERRIFTPFGLFYLYFRGLVIADKGWTRMSADERLAHLKSREEGNLLITRVLAVGNIPQVAREEWNSLSVDEKLIFKRVALAVQNVHMQINQIVSHSNLEWISRNYRDGSYNHGYDHMFNQIIKRVMLSVMVEEWRSYASNVDKFNADDKEVRDAALAAICAERPDCLAAKFRGSNFDVAVFCSTHFKDFREKYGNSWIVNYYRGLEKSEDGMTSSEIYHYFSKIGLVVQLESYGLGDMKISLHCALEGVLDLSLSDSKWSDILRIDDGIIHSYRSNFPIKHGYLHRYEHGNDNLYVATFNNFRHLCIATLRDIDLSNRDEALRYKWIVFKGSDQVKIDFSWLSLYLGLNMHDIMSLWLGRPFMYGTPDDRKLVLVFLAKLLANYKILLQHSGLGDWQVRVQEVKSEEITSCGWSYFPMTREEFCASLFSRSSYGEVLAIKEDLVSSKSSKYCQIDEFGTVAVPSSLVEIADCRGTLFGNFIYRELHDKHDLIGLHDLISDHDSRHIYAIVYDTFNRICEDPEKLAYLTSYSPIIEKINLETKEIILPNTISGDFSISSAPTEEILDKYYWYNFEWASLSANPAMAEVYRRNPSKYPWIIDQLLRNPGLTAAERATIQTVLDQQRLKAKI